MRCKICDTPFTSQSLGIGTLRVLPNCDCGKIRKKLREEGCPVYECASDMIDIEQDPIGVKATCRECGYNWYPKEYRE